MNSSAAAPPEPVSTEPEASEGTDHMPDWPIDAPPPVTTAMSPHEVLDALTALSRRGKLPGFTRLQDASPDGRSAEPGVFRADVFGLHYDRELIGTVAATDAGSTITFESKLKRKMPIIVITVFILCIWPGTWLTDSMLVTYFGWYPSNGWFTYAWYVPLMLLSIPLLMKQYKTSMAMAHAESKDVVEKVKEAVEGRLG